MIFKFAFYLKEKTCLTARCLFSYRKALWYRFANRFHALPISARMDQIIIGVTFHVIRRAMLTTHILITSHDYTLIKASVTQYRPLHLLRYHIRNLVTIKILAYFTIDSQDGYTSALTYAIRLWRRFGICPYLVTRHKRNKITILSPGDYFIII